MRARCAMLVVAAGCNSILGNGNFKGPGGDDTSGGVDACSGIGCMVADCASRGKPPTSVSGTVYAPNGTLPLYNALVYVPTSPVAPMVDGPTRACASGMPAVHTLTDVTGRFKLESVPNVENLPVVIQVGKWRRQLVLPKVNECDDLALEAQLTRLPRDRSEGDIPHLAMTTGAPEAIECLIHDLGVADSEISNGTGTGRIHLYFGQGGTMQISGGAALEPLETVMSRLMQYDQVVLGCDANQAPRQPTLQAMLRQYVDAGGWLWVSHFQSAWLAAPAFPPLANFVFPGPMPPSPFQARIEMTFPRATAFAQWMLNVGGATSTGLFPIQNGRNTCMSLVDATVQRWVSIDPPAGNGIQMFTWQEPTGGTVVFADIHLQASPPPPNPFPTECLTMPLSPQAKSIAFQLFDQPVCLE